MSKMAELIDAIYNSDKFTIDAAYEMFVLKSRTITTLIPDGWTPDWDNIKYDHLRMDKSGIWHSFNTCNIYFAEDTRKLQGEWMFASSELDNGDRYHTESVPYLHTNPEFAIYTRPLDGH